MTSFRQPPCPKTRSLFVVLVCSWGGGGGGGGGEDKAASPAVARLDRRAHMISELAVTSDDWGFGPTSERC